MYFRVKWGGPGRGFPIRGAGARSVGALPCWDQGGPAGGRPPARGRASLAETGTYREGGKREGVQRVRERAGGRTGFDPSAVELEEANFFSSFPSFCFVREVAARAAGYVFFCPL